MIGRSNAQAAPYSISPPAPTPHKLPSARSIGGLLREGREMLARSGVPNAAQEACWILREGLGISQLALHVDAARIPREEERQRVWALLQRRAKLEPLQYILGSQEFCGLSFLVTPAVLIPRLETELLVEEAVRFAKTRSWPVLVDLGTGSGCIAVAMAAQVPNAKVYATDISAASLAIARTNAQRQGVDGRVEFLDGDFLAPLQRLRLERRVSALACNPPYVPDHEVSHLQPEVARHEPRLALAGGPDGCDFHRRLLSEAPAFLEDGGLLILEVGEGQARPMAHLATQLGPYRDVQILEDHAGLPRVLRLERSSAFA